MLSLRVRTPTERAELARLPLKEYYQNNWWRCRRANFLEAKGQQCERCHATREIDVHHVSYDRLGAEQDRDLEVVCRRCHENLHRSAVGQQDLRAYLHLAQETLRLDQPTSLADLEACLRVRCRDLKLPLDARIDRTMTSIAQGAAQLVNPDRRIHIADARPEWRDLPDINATEARTVFATVVNKLQRDLDAPHSLKHLIKTMPSVYTHDAAHEARVRAQADEFRGYAADPAEERRRERRKLGEERVAWEREQLAASKEQQP